MTPEQVYRWLVLPQWRVLHRVAQITWDDSDKIAGVGKTVCGRSGLLQTPGVLSRLGLPRCRQCCRILGLRQGNGVIED